MYDDPMGCLPYPELVEPTFNAKDYEIHDSRYIRGAASIGMVSKVERIMLVPLSSEGQSVRRHELGHVKWSPRRLPKVPFDSLIFLAVEDARINSALRRRGLDCSDEQLLRDHAVGLAMNDIAKKEYAVFLLRCIASIGTDAGEAFAEIARVEAPYVHTVVQRLIPLIEARLEQSRLRTREKIIASNAAAKRIATEVAKEFEHEGYAISAETRRRLMGEGAFCLACKGKAGDAAHGVMPGPFSRVQDCKSAKMLIAEPTLTVPLTPRGGRGEMGRRSVREGAIVRTVNRWFSDKKIFRGKRTRHSGGTVLIDTSSSMRLSAADVDTIVKSAPAATLVAMYSGHFRKGELRIIARGGRRAAAEQLAPYGPGNLVDLPALEWLARQPAPRIWISDARVTGINDYGSKTLARRCRVVCLRNGIRRAETAADAAAILEGRSRRRLPLMLEA